MKSKRLHFLKVRQLGRLIEDRSSMLIAMQDYPDPDAIASAVALRAFANAASGIRCTVAHGAEVGRAENRALVKYLGLKLHRLENMDLGRFDTVAMVDTQPGAGNNSLPATVLPDIVIDHHPICRATRSVEFTDIRSRYGATSTILYEYLQTAGITPDAALATALLHGIRSDTRDLGCEARRPDIDASLALYPMANKRALGRIEWERVPAGYFRLLVRALAGATTHGKCVVSTLGEIDNPDIIGEAADLLLWNETSEWSLCCGFSGGKMLLSFRTSDADADAGALARQVTGGKGTGGGHSALAGGQIPLARDTPAERRKLEKLVIRRFLRILGCRERPAGKLID